MLKDLETDVTPALVAPVVPEGENVLGLEVSVVVPVTNEIENTLD